MSDDPLEIDCDDEALDRLAIELLGRRCSDLDADEQLVLKRVLAGTFVGCDADETAQLNSTWGDRLADKVAAVGGSWGFIVAFMLVMAGWMAINVAHFGGANFDPYPFILLNLTLSTLAALQAPVIMMSQNRQSKKDRITARHDYEVNLRTQLEIVRLSRKLDKMMHLAIREAKKTGEEIEEVIEEIKHPAK